MKMSLGRLVLACATIAVIVAFTVSTATSTYAGVLYSTGFESPTFSPGPINGQGGWFSIGEIQSAVVKSGAQALKLDASSSGGAALPLNYPVGNQTFVFEVDFLWHGTGSSQAGIAVFGDTGFLAQEHALSSLFTLGNVNQSAGFQPTASKDTWYHLKMVLDFQTKTISGFVDGNSFGSVAMNPPSPASEIAFVYTYSTEGTQSVYFDNLSISTIPEPSTLALMGLGGLGLAVRAYRRRHGTAAA